jgi:SAM-dependent methyltransferase
MGSYGEQYTRYQLRRSPLRKWVRRWYLRSAVRQLRGPTIDFGCGVGELLERLPPGSVGLEINPASVEHCRSNGLDVLLYDADGDGWSLSVLPVEKTMQSLVVSHVLEHLDQPMRHLSTLLQACGQRGISRVLVIVPGRRGYACDDTHRTFIDLPMLSAPDVVAGSAFRLASSRYFPGNLRRLGELFPHHELQALFLADGA